MKMAAAANDIATVIRLIASTSALKPTDFIRKTVGSLLFIYYMYVDNLHVKPRDLRDLVDGLLYLEAKAYAEEQRRLAEEQRKKK